MPRKILFFINPVSGTKSKLHLEKKIIQKCNGKNIAHEILFTSVDGNYSFLKDRISHEGITDIIICGGDGSLRAVIAAVLNIKVNIGIIPLGSGNGLAFTAKIPKQIDKAFEVIFNEKNQCVDAFLINGTLGCMLCGIGLDAQVAYDFSLQKKRGLSTYVKQSLKNFISARSYGFHLKTNETNFKTDAYFVCVANSNQFGNNFKIAPKADLSDGLLDVIVVKKMSKPKIAWSVFKQMQSGKLSDVHSKDLHQKNILYFQTKNIDIVNSEMAPLHIDGDHVPTAKKLSVEIIPSAFHLLVP
jgi:YegS/Rv2252/BmrU family lipid kinase